MALCACQLFAFRMSWLRRRVDVPPTSLESVHNFLRTHYITRKREKCVSVLRCWLQDNEGSKNVAEWQRITFGCDSG